MIIDYKAAWRAAHAITVSERKDDDIDEHEFIARNWWLAFNTILNSKGLEIKIEKINKEIIPEVV